METTRHFTATVYVVNDGAVLLHEHERLGLWLPPGGHVDRDELPHEAAIRETREETGLEVRLRRDHGDVRSETVRSLPEPEHMLLEDINVHDGEVGHQHVDFIYYGRAEYREIAPADGETSSDAWEWVTAAELRSADRFDPDVVRVGSEALEAMER